MRTFEGSALLDDVACRARTGRARPRKAEGRLHSRPSVISFPGCLVARARRWFFCVAASATGPVAGACPRRPEDHREDQTDRADDHQDPADRVFVDAAYVAGDAPDEHGADGDQDQAHSDSHSDLLSGPVCYPALAGDVPAPEARKTLFVTPVPKRRSARGLSRLAAVRRGVLVRLVAVGLAAPTVAFAVAFFVPWLPTPASKQADRIDFVFWFVSIISIA